MALTSPTSRPPHTALAATLVSAACAACLACAPASSAEPASGAPGPDMTDRTREVRIGYLHHSTGEAVWNGGVPEFIQKWNDAHGTRYRIREVTYPATTGGGWPPLLRRLVSTYPWANYPYDYWNLWVSHTGSSHDRGEKNLDDLAKEFDVIVFKHCFPVSRVQPGGATPRVDSDEKTIANYKLQYAALKERLHQFPKTRFIVWTGAALPESSTSPDDARRARDFFEWVKGSWDEKGDNVFVWDFLELETGGGLFLKPEHGSAPGNAHPGPAFSRRVAPLVGRRIVDVVEGRGDETQLTGEAP